ncbi:MAG: FecR family protein [Achromobacter veterisilvae]
MPPIDDSAHRAGRPPDALEHPRDAAQWFARMHSGEVTEEERRAFAAWRAADPEHDRRYDKLARLWDAASSVPESRLRAMAADPAAPPKSLSSRRRFGLGLAAVCTLAVTAGALRQAGWLGEAPQYAAELETRKGERRRVPLPDGSTLDLNSDTRVTLRLCDDQRLLVLHCGEVFLDVAPDASRPFVVDAGVGQAAATGTRFDVRRDADAMRVTVESGSVQVASGRWWRRSVRELTANQQIVARAGQAPERIQRVNAAEVAAWQRGKVVFNNVPLASVVHEMNRYLAYPARLAGTETGKYRVSGVFSVDDPDAMIDALPSIAPVHVRRLPDGGVVIAATAENL